MSCAEQLASNAADLQPAQEAFCRNAVAAAFVRAISEASSEEAVQPSSMGPCEPQPTGSSGSASARRRSGGRVVIAVATDIEQAPLELAGNLAILEQHGCVRKVHLCWSALSFRLYLATL
jgi:hypothetical protein